jgi:hypothetical protein
MSAPLPGYRKCTMTRFADVHVFGPEAALAELRLQAAHDEPEPEEPDEPEPEPKTERDDDRERLAARERALRHSWDITPR